MVCSHSELVFVLKQCFALKSFPATHDTFSNAYPDKEVHDKAVGSRVLGRRKFLPGTNAY